MVVEKKTSAKKKKAKRQASPMIVPKERRASPLIVPKERDASVESIDSGKQVPQRRRSVKRETRKK